MKRDMELIKQILKYVEQNDKNDGRLLPAPEFPDYGENEVSYHIDLCEQAGYITVQRTSGGSFLRSLSWQGHNALDELRSRGAR